MNVLVVRHDADGKSFWHEYSTQYGWETSELFRDIEANLNTVGVSRIEIICGT